MSLISLRIYNGEIYIFKWLILLDTPSTQCAHCRPGVPCDPFSGACMECK